ncbi:MAG: Uncharacterised protein [Cellulomonadaceae bacterium TMED98]|nr:MAG: Uncharacterised protein [Cellulomonadaceae bacterium TMED98]
MKSHRRQDHHQSERIPRPVRVGISVEKYQVEQISRQQEMRRHPDVTQMVLEGPGKKRRVVEDNERQAKQGCCDKRVSKDFQIPRIHCPQYPLSGSPRAIFSRLDGASGQRHRSSQHKQERNRHAEDHVRQHVHAEKKQAVDIKPGACREQQQDHSCHPREGPHHRPVIPPRSKSPHALEIKRCR